MKAVLESKIGAGTGATAAGVAVVVAFRPSALARHLTPNVDASPQDVANVQSS